MGEFNYILHHKPAGIINRADALSQQPNYPLVDRSAEETLLEGSAFLNTIDVQEINHIMQKAQEGNTSEMEELVKAYPLEKWGNI